LRTHKRTHCERMLDHQVLLLDTRVAVGIASSITKCCWIPWWPSLVGSSQAIELPRWPVASRARSPSAAAGYPGGRHSCKAEWSWVPIRTFDRSPPMGTVLTVDRLSFGRSGFPTSTDVHPMCGDVVRRSPNVWRRGQTFTQCVETWSDVHPTCGDIARR
jgi:hypothetical protein